MKAIKKIFTTIICLCMIFGCVSVTAFAEETASGSITVENQTGTNASVAGKTLNLFKIFNAKSNGSNISYSWIEKGGVELYKTFFFGDPDIKDDDGNQIFTNRIGEGKSSINDVVAYINGLKEDSFAFSQMAASLHQYIHAKGITADKSSGVIASDATSYTFSGLDLGYYLIYDATEIAEDSPAVRSAAMLAHPGESKVIQLKADRPHIEKYVDDNDADDTEDWQYGTTASIGDTVTFRIVTAIPDHDLYGDDYTFIIIDEMANELELIKDSIKVTVTQPSTLAGDDDTSANEVEYFVYTEQADIKDTAVDFKVVMNKITELPTDTIVEIVYKAKVTANAKSHNINTATLTYSNDPNDKTSTGAVESTVTVALWQFTLTKHVEDTNGTPSYMRLAGAEFEIYKVEGDTETLLKFSDTATVTSEAGVTYTKYIFDQANGNVTTLKTLDSGDKLDDGTTDVGYTDGGHLGQILIFGLGEGTYRIRETKAPDGYLKADGDFEFTLTDTIGQTGAVANAEISQIAPEKPGQFTRVMADETNLKYYVGVTNAPGSALPETGGIGTTIFTILGVVLMAGALAFFTLRKRGSAD